MVQQLCFFFFSVAAFLCGNGAQDRVTYSHNQHLSPNVQNDEIPRDVRVALADELTGILEKQTHLRKVTAFNRSSGFVEKNHDVNDIDPQDLSTKPAEEQKNILTAIYTQMNSRIDSNIKELQKKKQLIETNKLSVEEGISDLELLKNPNLNVEDLYSKYNITDDYQKNRHYLVNKIKRNKEKVLNDMIETIEQTKNYKDLVLEETLFDKFITHIKENDDTRDILQKLKSLKDIITNEQIKTYPDTEALSRNKLEIKLRDAYYKALFATEKKNSESDALAQKKEMAQSNHDSFQSPQKRREQQKANKIIEHLKKIVEYTNTYKDKIYNENIHMFSNRESVIRRTKKNNDSSDANTLNMNEFTNNIDTIIISEYINNIKLDEDKLNELIIDVADLIIKSETEKESMDAILHEMVEKNDEISYNLAEIALITAEKIISELQTIKEQAENIINIINSHNTTNKRGKNALGISSVNKYKIAGGVTIGLLLVGGVLSLVGTDVFQKGVEHTKKNSGNNSWENNHSLNDEDDEIAIPVKEILESYDYGEE